jgi:glycolate oxidase
MSASALETRAPAIPIAIVDRLRAVVGDRNCIIDPSQLRTYESDGLTSFHAMPGIVVLPSSTEEVVEIVKITERLGCPSCRAVRR